MPKDRTCVPAQSQLGGSLHNLDSLFTRLNWVLEDKEGNQSLKNVDFCSPMYKLESLCAMNPLSEP